MMDTTLHLHEEVLLLALDDEKGTTSTGSMWQNAAGGAIVAELLLQGRVRATDEKKPKLEVVDPTPLGDPVLDEALAEIAASKPKQGKHWVQKYGARGELKDCIAEGLVRKGVLRAEEGKVLWIFPTTRYPERDGRPENEVKRRLERAIFRDDHDVLPRTIVLVSLCRASDLLPAVFDKKRLKRRQERLEKLTAGETTGAMTREAVEAVQAAVAVAAVMPVIVVAATN